MGQPGYVYVLTNSALGGLVKIGKTARDPQIRASELSAATGVPTPFVVAYDVFLPDCDHAEEIVHARLAAFGARIADNREFFAVSLRDAVHAINEAERVVRREVASGFDSEDSPVQQPSDVSLFDGSDADAWADVLEKAEAYRNGDSTTLEDPARALALYKNAAQLGAPEAFGVIADMYAAGEGCTRDLRESIQWLQRGAERGHVVCWRRLAWVYSGTDRQFDELPPHPDNALRCWRKFFLGYSLEAEVAQNRMLDSLTGDTFLTRSAISQCAHDLESYVNLADRRFMHPEDLRIASEYARRVLQSAATLARTEETASVVARIEQILQRAA